MATEDPVMRKTSKAELDFNIGKMQITCVIIER